MPEKLSPPLSEKDRIRAIAQEVLVKNQTYNQHPEIKVEFTGSVSLITRLMLRKSRESQEKRWRWVLMQSGGEEVIKRQMREWKKYNIKPQTTSKVLRNASRDVYMAITDGFSSYTEMQVYLRKAKKYAVRSGRTHDTHAGGPPGGTGRRTGGLMGKLRNQR